MAAREVKPRNLAATRVLGAEEVPEQHGTTLSSASGLPIGRSAPYQRGHDQVCRDGRTCATMITEGRSALLRAQVAAGHMGVLRDAPGAPRQRVGIPGMDGFFHSLGGFALAMTAGALFFIAPPEQVSGRG